MANHLLTQTLPPEIAASIRYYTRDDQAATIARPQPGMHPMVARGLAIDPQRPLTHFEISALLAGRRADGEKIVGKHYAEVRTYIDKKTGRAKESIPLGSVDFRFCRSKRLQPRGGTSLAVGQYASE
jgi:hypothetical protein